MTHATTATVLTVRAICEDGSEPDVPGALTGEGIRVKASNLPRGFVHFGFPATVGIRIMVEGEIRASDHQAIYSGVVT